jgi:hypothetical protein
MGSGLEIKRLIAHKRATDAADAEQIELLQYMTAAERSELAALLGEGSIPRPRPRVKRASPRSRVPKRLERRPAKLDRTAR